MTQWADLTGFLHPSDPPTPFNPRSSRPRLPVAPPVQIQRQRQGQPHQRRRREDEPPLFDPLRPRIKERPHPEDGN